MKEVMRSNNGPVDYLERFVVISLGTGSAKQEHKYTAEMAAKLGLFGWVGPILDLVVSLLIDSTQNTPNLLISPNSFPNGIEPRTSHSSEGPSGQMG
ncbi:hypothetical protein ACS0TY_031698 [Phlomoides rotata]